MPKEIDGVTYFTQEEVNDLTGTARKEGREVGVKKTKEEVNEQLSELQAFKDLAEKREADLEKLNSNVESYSEAVEGVLELRKEKMSKKAKKALEDLPIDSLGKLKWLNENKELFEKTPGTPKSEPPRSTPDNNKRSRRISL